MRIIALLIYLLLLNLTVWATDIGTPAKEIRQRPASTETRDKLVKRLIEEFGAEDFQSREQVEEALTQMGRTIRPQLLAAQSEDPEVRLRLRRILARTAHIRDAKTVQEAICFRDRYMHQAFEAVRRGDLELVSRPLDLAEKALKKAESLCREKGRALIMGQILSASGRRLTSLLKETELKRSRKFLIRTALADFKKALEWLRESKTRSPAVMKAETEVSMSYYMLLKCKDI